MNRETTIRVSKYAQDTHLYTVSITGEPMSIVKTLAELGDLDLVSYNYQDWKPHDCEKKKPHTHGDVP